MLNLRSWNERDVHGPQSSHVSPTIPGPSGLAFAPVSGGTDIGGLLSFDRQDEFDDVVPGANRAFDAQRQNSLLDSTPNISLRKCGDEHTVIDQVRAISLCFIQQPFIFSPGSQGRIRCPYPLYFMLADEWTILSDSELFRTSVPRLCLHRTLTACQVLHITVICYIHYTINEISTKYLRTWTVECNREQFCWVTNLKL